MQRAGECASDALKTLHHVCGVQGNCSVAHGTCQHDLAEKACRHWTKATYAGHSSTGTAPHAATHARIPIHAQLLRKQLEHESAKGQDYREKLRDTRAELSSKDRQLDVARRMLAKVNAEKNNLEVGLLFCYGAPAQALRTIEGAIKFVAALRLFKIQCK